MLINNAGALFSDRRMTKDGLEMTFAVNHMAYFVVTNSCSNAGATPGARIVSTASAAHYGTRLDFTDLQALKGYNTYAAYGRSKLCNILFTRALAKRLDGTGITANCLHPGFVATRFGDNTNALFSSAIRLAKRAFRQRAVPRPSSISRRRLTWPTSAAAISTAANSRRQRRSPKRRGRRASLGRLATSHGPQRGLTRAQNKPHQRSRFRLRAIDDHLKEPSAHFAHTLFTALYARIWKHQQARRVRSAGRAQRTLAATPCAPHLQ